MLFVLLHYSKNNVILFVNCIFLSTDLVHFPKILILIHGTYGFQKYEYTF